MGHIMVIWVQGMQEKGQRQLAARLTPCLAVPTEATRPCMNCNLVCEKNEPGPLFAVLVFRPDVRERRVLNIHDSDINNVELDLIEPLN